MIQINYNITLYIIRSIYKVITESGKRKFLNTKSCSNLLKTSTCKIKYNSQKEEVVNVSNIAKYFGTGCLL